MFTLQIPPYTFISGQIGLIPSSLTLPSPSSTTSPESSTISSTLPLETALVLQHTARIIRAAPNSGLGDGSEGGFGGSDPGSGDDSRYGHGEGGWIQLAVYYLVHVADVDHVRKNVESIDGVRLPRSSSLENTNVMTDEADTDGLCSRFVPSTRRSYREASPRAQRPIYHSWFKIIRGRGW